jgi:hypothetical protein
MGNAARKARKRAGIKFSKPAKVATPLEDRSIPAVTKKTPFGMVTGQSNRAVAKLVRMIEARDSGKEIEENIVEKPKRASRAKKTVEA